MAVGFANGSLQLYSLPEVHRLWDKSNAHQERINRLAFSPDNLSLVSAGKAGEIKLWRLNGASNPIMLNGPTALANLKGPVHAVAFSPDGSKLASTGDNGEILLFDLRTKLSDPDRFNASSSGILSVAFATNEHS
jgi:WD40 repeat protein